MGHEVPGAPDTEARRAPGLHEHRGDGVSEGRHQRLVGRQHHAGRAQPDGRRALGDGRQDHRRRPGAPRGARDPELVEPELLGTDRPREVPWRAVPSDSSIRVRYRFSRDTPGSVSISTDVPQWCAAARSSTHLLPQHRAGKGGKRWPLTSVDSWTCPSSPMSHRWIPLTARPDRGGGPGAARSCPDHYPGPRPRIRAITAGLSWAASRHVRGRP